MSQDFRTVIHVIEERRGRYLLTRGGPGNHFIFYLCVYTGDLRCFYTSFMSNQLTRVQFNKLPGTR